MPNPYGTKLGDGFTRGVGNVRQFPGRNRSTVTGLPFIADGNAGLPLREDVQQSVYTAGYNGQLRKMDMLGNVLWEVTSGGGIGAQSGGVDRWGNVILQTSSVVKKFSPDGVLLWSYNDVSGTLYSLVVDRDGFIYVGGAGQLVRKISPNGVSMWTHNIANTIHLLAVDKNGIVYCGDGGTNMNKIDSNGRLIKRWAAGGSLNLREGLVVGANQNIYLVLPVLSKIVVFDQNGDLIYTLPISPAPLNITSVMVDRNNNLYVSYDEYLAKYDPGFNKLWTYYSGTASLYPNRCQVDKNGQIYLAFGGNGEKFRILSPFGKLLKNVNFVGNSYDNLCALTPGESGIRVYRKRFLGQ